jgi:DNA-binding HxlR family transcriptional regulator
MKTATTDTTKSECARMILPVKDALDIMSGRWRLPIILSICFGTKRFKEISREINGITDKILSKELKELEANQIITRTVHDTVPPSVEYTIPPHGLTLGKVIISLKDWGIEHRKKIMVG